MRQCEHLLLLIIITSICWSGCSNQDEVQISFQEQNLLKLQTIAKEVGANVQIELFNEHTRRPLTNLEIRLYKNEFEKVVALNNYKIELSLIQSYSRAIESYSHYGGVEYDGHIFDLTIFWKIDNETGEIFDILGGLGGEKKDFYDPYDYTIREMIQREQTINYANNEQISISLKADYVVSVYTPTSTGDHLSSRITSKVTAAGIVYIKSNTSSFTMHSSGEGSWAEDMLEP